MVRKRSRLEMYLDVLETIKSGVNKPTNIMYKCNLSWIPTQEIIASLIEKGLIDVTEKRRKKTYEITEKGRDLLSYLEDVLDLLVTHRRRAVSITNEHKKPTILKQPDLRRKLPYIPQRTESSTK